MFLLFSAMTCFGLCGVAEGTVYCTSDPHFNLNVDSLNPPLHFHDETHTVTVNEFKVL